MSIVCGRGNADFVEGLAATIGYPVRVVRLDVGDVDREAYSALLARWRRVIGEPPWAELRGPDAVELAAVKKERPNVPRHWDARLATLTRSCWADDPATRPSFAAALEVLDGVFKTAVGSSYEETLKRGPGAGGSAGCCSVM